MKSILANSLLFGLAYLGASSAFFIPLEFPQSLTHGWEHGASKFRILFTSTKESLVDTTADDGGNDDDKRETILERLRRDDRFSRLVKVLEEHRGLRDDLENAQNRLTFFAPTNDAFERMKQLHDTGNFPTHEEAILGRFARNHAGQSMEDIIRYHMTAEELRLDRLFDGKLISTEFKPSELNRKRQRIRLFRVQDDVYLNMYARIEEADIETANGVVHVIDRVLTLPPNAWDTLYMLPTEFSTLLAAVNRVGMARDIEKARGVTIFAPNNVAWENLGLRNLLYLFSRDGEKDLIKILQYHISPNLMYSDEMMDHEGKTLDLPTLLKNETLHVVAHRRGGKGAEDVAHRASSTAATIGFDGFLGRLLRREELHGCIDAVDDDGGADRKPEDYSFDINDGEAFIRFADGLAGNGVVHLISTVLVPTEVELPGRVVGKHQGGRK